MGGGASGTTSAIATGSGTLNLASNFTYQGNVANDNGATITGSVNLGAATRTFLVNNSTAAASDVAVLGDISGTGGLRKTGAGTLQLLGNNNYIGATTVAEGELGVVGTLSGSSAVSVEAPRCFATVTKARSVLRVDELPDCGRADRYRGATFGFQAAVGAWNRPRSAFR